jgi:hypothetical protein
MKRLIRDLVVALLASVLAIPVYAVIVGGGRALSKLASGPIWHRLNVLWVAGWHDRSPTGRLIAALVPVGIALISCVPAAISVLTEDRKRSAARTYSDRRYSLSAVDRPTEQYLLGGRTGQQVNILGSATAISRYGPPRSRQPAVPVRPPQRRSGKPGGWADLN